MAQEEGPDRIISTENLTNCARDGCVKLRMIPEFPGNRDSMSLITFTKKQCQVTIHHSKSYVFYIFPFKSSSTKLQVVTILLNWFSQDAGDRNAMTVKREGELVKWSYSEYLKDITSVAKAFIHLGLEHHNGVAIWGFNSPEWFISDVASIFAGGVVSC